MTVRRLRRPRRADVLLGALLTTVVVGVLMVGLLVAIANAFEPQGSLFGRPLRIPTCGQTYATTAEVTTVYTRAEIESMAPGGLGPVVVEPVVGQVPLFAPFSAAQRSGAAQPCDAFIYLRVGPDSYAAYGLQVTG
jgi:hypothetical protein